MVHLILMGIFIVMSVKTGDATRTVSALQELTRTCEGAQKIEREIEGRAPQGKQESRRCIAASATVARVCQSIAVDDNKMAAVSDSTAYKKTALKRYPAVQQRETAEARYWRRFKRPAVHSHQAPCTSIHFSPVGPS